MNKSILKHEFRTMKWTGVFSALIGVFLVFVFSLNLNMSFEQLFTAKAFISNAALVNRDMEVVKVLAIMLFSILAIVQILLQFKSEKGQDISRFLKSLPVDSGEFFKIKLLFGIINITIGFIVFIIGFEIVRSGNQFWLEDIYKSSLSYDIVTRVESFENIILELGLIYLGVLTFYTFLFMVQYSFSNLIGGVVTGILSYFGPIFIAFSNSFIASRYFGRSVLDLVFRFLEYGRFLLPLAYSFERSYIRIGDYSDNLGVYADIVKDLPLKYVLCLLVIAFNILVGYYFAKKKKVEDENKIITFRVSRIIFKVGVTACSFSLVSTFMAYFLNVKINDILFFLLSIVSGFIGYVVSDRITKVGMR